jgi:hypothetical protein
VFKHDLPHRLILKPLKVIILTFQKVIIIYEKYFPPPLIKCICVAIVIPLRGFLCTLLLYEPACHRQGGDGGGVVYL